MNLLTSLFFCAASAFSTQAFCVQNSCRLAFQKTSLDHPSKRSALKMSFEDRYTIPDQPARFARAKEQNNQRYLDITTVYDPSYLKGKRVAVTGANRGIGLALSKELVKQGANLVAIVRSSSTELDELKPDEIISGIEATDDKSCESIPSKIKGGPIDIVSKLVRSHFILVIIFHFY